MPVFLFRKRHPATRRNQINPSRRKPARSVDFRLLSAGTGEFPLLPGQTSPIMTASRGIPPFLPAMQALSVNDFLELSSEVPIIDVRAPCEFAQGHIPGATNLPLFDDAERAEVGTLYRQSGREKALLRGLELAGTKMSSLARKGLALFNRNRSRLNRNSKTCVLPDLLVHCWRGGMRSQSIGWLFEQVDLSVAVLDGGYRAFRRAGREHMLLPVPLIALGGLTGSGKTRQLAALDRAGEPVIDLEKLANHRGSAFGGVGLGQQPTAEQFENDLHMELRRVQGQQRVWIEAESRLIGRIAIPEPFFAQAVRAPLVIMKVPLEKRIQLLTQEYSDVSRESLVECVEKIRKRLGGLDADAAIRAVQEGDFGLCAQICLKWYDRSYGGPKYLESRTIAHEIDISEPGSAEATSAIVELGKSIFRPSLVHLAQ
jgi:tRNA 2-selenouridine synthase